MTDDERRSGLHLPMMHIYLKSSDAVLVRSKAFVRVFFNGIGKVEKDFNNLCFIVGPTLL